MAPECPAHVPYRALSQLPEAIWRWSVVCSGGTTDQRLEQLPRWLASLRQGQLPDAPLDWADPEALEGFRRLIGELALPQLARGQDSVTIHILQSLMWHLDQIIDRPAAESRLQAIARLQQTFHDSWQFQKQGWEEALALLPDLGQARLWRWDDLAGQLNRREWAEARRIGGWLAQLPALQRFIDQVGRRKPAEPAAGTSPPTTHETALRRPVEEDPAFRLSEPGHVDGVRRSRVLARMTGAETAMLHHPTLRRSWKARFAEAQLLTYDDRTPGDRRGHQTTLPIPPAQAPHQQDRGPMIVCLDTSGSMQGAPENVAKACVLQALRTASASQRACRLLAFGGQGELLDRELTPTREGLETLLDTLGQGFDGGTDVQTPIERAIEHVRQARWNDADLLIVSDGEFGVTPTGLRALRQAKASLGLRVHGILIGDRETIGLLEVCDELHWVREWRRYAEAARAAAEHFSPVHSRSLTALYFPNAVRRADDTPPR